MGEAGPPGKPVPPAEVPGSGDPPAREAAGAWERWRRGSSWRTGIELAILGAIWILIGRELVPAHWTSIWMDREFTGTVIALANRLEGGVRLYADGGHLPLSPLPFVFMRLLTGGEGLWIHESLANFVFQCLTVMMGYAALARVVPRPVPFMAAALGSAAFFCLPKTVLYDAMVQAWVAGLGWLAAVHLGRPARGQAGWKTLAPLAAVSAVALLTKQSTALGAIAGLGLAIVLMGRGPLRIRLAAAFGYGVMTLAAAAALALCLAPWIDPAGLVNDVFRRGSEPKGGVARMLESLRGTGGYLLEHLRRQGLPLLVVAAAVAVGAKRARVRIGPLPPVFAWAVAVLAPLGLTLLYTRVPGSGRLPAEEFRWLIVLGPAGLLIGLILTVQSPWRVGLVRWVRLPRPRVFGGVFLVFFAAAVFHSLSAGIFRWGYDNNPLILAFYAVLFQIVLQVPRTLGWARGWHLAAAVLLFLILHLRPWHALIGHQIAAARNCTKRWPEVVHLVGARLQPEAIGARRLVARVREQAGPGETVLMLPADPNVESWFERDLPRLSSLCLFSDLYWDSEVDGDLARIEADPPKVIVVGPVKSWRGFHRQFTTNAGVERLIDQLEGSILLSQYERQTVRIRHNGQDDRMVVYVRREPAAPPPVAAGAAGSPPRPLRMGPGGRGAVEKAGGPD